MVNGAFRANQRICSDKQPARSSRDVGATKNVRVDQTARLQPTNMDILHTQLAAIQHRLAFVQTDPIDWRSYVLVFSWGICLFESYLLYARIHPPFATDPYAHACKNPPSLVQPAAISTLFKAISTRCPCRSLYISGIRKISEIWETQGQVFHRIRAV